MPSIWIRAQKSGTPVTLSLVEGEGMPPYRTPFETTDLISGNWEEIDLDAQVPDMDDWMFMITINQPGTVWVDDAKLLRLGR